MGKQTKTGLYKKSEELAKLAERTGWLESYERVKKEFSYTENGKTKKLTWQQAAYLAWLSAPKKNRMPKNRTDVATLLNYNTRTTMYLWERKEWFKEAEKLMRENLFLKHIGEVEMRTVEAALTEVGTAGVASRQQYYDRHDRITEGRVLEEEINGLIEQAIERRMSENNND